MRKKRAGRGKRDEHERIERQQDHRGIQRERQREAEAARGGQRTQSLPHCAAGEPGDGKGVALEKPQGERKQRADERLRQK